VQGNAQPGNVTTAPTAPTAPPPPVASPM
jgi:hypothetical protein